MKGHSKYKGFGTLRNHKKPWTLHLYVIYKVTPQSLNLAYTSERDIYLLKH